MKSVIVNFNKDKIIYFSLKKYLNFKKNCTNKDLLILDKIDKFVNKSYKFDNNAAINFFVKKKALLILLSLDKNLETFFTFLKKENNFFKNAYDFSFYDDFITVLKYGPKSDQEKFWHSSFLDSTKFSKLPPVNGIILKDNFLVFDGHHRCTLYVLSNNLDLKFNLYDS